MLTSSQEQNLSATYIEQQLQNAGFSLHVQVKQKVDSTNELLKRYAGQGESRDMAVIAQEQSAGKGRRGRSFFSPEGTGIYMSLLLHPKVTADQAAMLTTLAAVAVSRAVEEVSEQEVQIKWVNDVWMRGRKISGILTECAPSFTAGRPEYVVVGLGINVFEPEGGFPEEIREAAGAVFLQGEKEKQRENLRSRLAALVLVQFMEYYRTFPERDYLEEYRRRCFVIGRQVRILTSEHTERRQQKALEGAGQEQQENRDRSRALVLGIDEACHLHVQYEDGTTEYLFGGEISVRMEGDGQISADKQQTADGKEAVKA